jgi:transposase-like protein
MLAVRRYLRFGLSYRDLEGFWQNAASTSITSPCSGGCNYVYRAIDEHGRVIDALVSRRRDIAAAHRLFAAAIDAYGLPEEVVTDRAAALANVIAQLIPEAVHNTEQYANNRIECDHERLKARLRPIARPQDDRTLSNVIRGHAFVQNIRRGHHELGTNPATISQASPPRSTNSPPRSDQDPSPRPIASHDRTTQQCPREPSGHRTHDGTLPGSRFPVEQRARSEAREGEQHDQHSDGEQQHDHRPHRVRRSVLFLSHGGPVRRLGGVDVSLRRMGHAMERTAASFYGPEPFVRPSPRRQCSMRMCEP